MTTHTPVQGYPQAGITNERENNINTGLSNNTNNRNASRFEISQSPQNYNRSDIGNIDKPLSRQIVSGQVGQRSGRRERGDGFDTYRSVPVGEPSHNHNEEVGDEVNRTIARARDIDNTVNEFDHTSKVLPQSVQQVEANMAFNGRAVEELEMRNKLHSAKIHELERELRNVKMENQVIRGRPGDNFGDDYGPNGDSGLQQGSPRNYGAKGGYQEYPGDAGDPRMREDSRAGARYTQYQPQPNAEQDGKGRRIYEYDQYKQFHRTGDYNGEIYWGLNKMYNPQSVTSYRREQVPLHLRKEEREQNHREPGGLMFVRFHDSGFDNVNLALRELQTIVKSYGGYVMGIARKHNIIVLDGDQGWYPGTKSRPRSDIPVNHKLTDNAVATFWFPNREKAFLFIGTSYKNRFADKNGFPNQYSYEAHFVPLLSAPSLRSQDTLMMVELAEARRYPEKDLKAFEEEARDTLKHVLPNSQQFLAAAPLTGNDSFKLGPMFSGRSKVFLSCVGSLAEVADVWRQGIIQDLQRKWNINGPMNVSAVALRDWSEF